MSKEIEMIIKKFASQLPKFEDGRIDYHGTNIAPVLNVFVKYKSEFLILKRSSQVRAYQGKWNSVAGYLDEAKPIEKKILEELQEEIGASEKIISQIKIGKHFEFFDKDINKTWIIVPALVELKEKPRIKLDWEHEDYRWIRKDELAEYDFIPNLDNTLNKVA